MTPSRRSPEFVWLRSECGLSLLVHGRRLPRELAVFYRIRVVLLHAVNAVIKELLGGGPD